VSPAAFTAGVTFVACNDFLWERLWERVLIWEGAWISEPKLGDLREEEWLRVVPVCERVEHSV